MSKLGLGVLLAALVLAWPVSRVIRQQVALSQPCAAGQEHDIRGQCGWTAKSLQAIRKMNQLCAQIGARFELGRGCLQTIDGREWVGVIEGWVDSQNGECPAGYVYRQDLAAQCISPDKAARLLPPAPITQPAIQPAQDAQMQALQDIRNTQTTMQREAREAAYQQQRQAAEAAFQARQQADAAAYDARAALRNP